MFVPLRCHYGAAFRIAMQIASGRRLGGPQLQSQSDQTLCMSCRVHVLNVDTASTNAGPLRCECGKHVLRYEPHCDNDPQQLQQARGWKGFLQGIL